MQLIEGNTAWQAASIMLQGVLHSVLQEHAAFHPYRMLGSMMHGMLHGMSDGMFHGMLHGMAYCCLHAAQHT